MYAIRSYYELQETLKKQVTQHFKDYDQATDEDVFVGLMRMLEADLDPSFLPEDFRNLMDKYSDEKLLKKVYRKSVLTDKAKLAAMIDHLDGKQIERFQKDPLIALFDQLRGYFMANIERPHREITEEISKLQKIYMAGIMAMKQGQALYPDANLTLRVAYGKVEGYKPADGVVYKYHTTLKGIMEKDNPDIYDYDVPQYLRDLYDAKDFSRYGKDGQIVITSYSIHYTKLYEIVLLSSASLQSKHHNPNEYATSGEPILL